MYDGDADARPGFKTTSLRPGLRCGVLRDTPIYDRLQALLKEAGLRRFCRGSVQAVLCAEDGCAVIAGAAISACTWSSYFEGIDSERGINVGVVRRFAVASRVQLRLASRDKVADPFLSCRRHLLAPAARGPRKATRVLSLVARARFGEGRADRRRRLDDGSQRCPADDRAARQRRDLSPDAGANGQARAASRRRRSTTWSGWIASARARNSRTRIADEPDRSGCEDRAA